MIDGQDEVLTSETETAKQLAEVQNRQETAVDLPTGTGDVNEFESVVDENLIEIDGQTFANEREAYEFMKKQYAESETERRIIEARAEAMRESMGSVHVPTAQQVANAAEANSDLNIDEFYENPQEFLKKYGENIRNSVKNEISQTMTAQEADRAAWSEFFSAHPDLDGFKDDCIATLNQHRETIELLARKDKPAAMKLLATKTREKFQRYMEAVKPQRVLPNTKTVGSAGNVGGNSVTHEQNSTQSEKPLDFATQLLNMRRR